MSTATQYNGVKVLDEDGNTIGEVSDVVFDSSSTTPTWFSVKPGKLRAEHWVPARGLRRTDRNEILVPYTSDRIRSSPKADRSHMLTKQQRALLAQHYALKDR